MPHFQRPVALLVLLMAVAVGGAYTVGTRGVSPDVGDVAQMRRVVYASTWAVDSGRATMQADEWLRVRPADRAGDEAGRLGRAVLRGLAYDIPGATQDLTRLTSRWTLPATQLYATLALADLAAARWDPSATALAQDAFTRALALQDSAAMAEALLLRGRMAWRLGSRDTAFVVYARAVQLAPSTDVLLHAKIDCQRGAAERWRDPAVAAQLIDAGMVLARSVGLHRLIGACLMARSQLYHGEGKQRLAVSAADSAIVALRRSGDAHSEASVWQLRSYVMSDFLGRLDEATSSAHAAIAAGERSGNPLSVAWAHLVLGQVQLRLGDSRSALDHADAAESRLRDLGDRWGLATVTLIQAEVAHAEGRVALAEAKYRSVAAQYQRADMRFALPEPWLRLAALARMRGALSRADSLLALTGAQVAMRPDLDQKVEHRYELALLREAQGRWDEAEALLADLAPQSAIYPDLDFAAASRRAQVAAGAGHMDEALLHLGQAEAALSARRAAITGRSERIVALRARRIDFDAGYGIPDVVRRFAAAGYGPEALYAAELHRARAGLRRVERQAAVIGSTTTNTRPELSDAPVVWSPEGARQLASRLPERTALVEFVIGRNGEPSTLLRVWHKGIEAVPVQLPANLEAQVADFSAALEADLPARAAGRALGQMLLPILAPLLKGDIERLLIVPDGPLHRLPFEALVLPDGRRLLEAVDVVMLPSARVLGPQPAPPHHDAGVPAIVAFGDAVFAAERRLPRLPASRAEAEGAAATTPAARLRLGADASEAELKRLARPGVRVLHLATHAIVSDGGLDGSMLALTAGAGEDGQVGPEEIAGLKLDADLVVLSACRTAGGRILWGEGLQGLTAPFLEAGARNVLATRWAIRDSELVPLMTSLYAQLGAGKSVGDAVRHVRLEALARGEGPRRWAALQLTGDGRAVPLPRASDAGVEAVASVRSQRVGPRTARSSRPVGAP